MPDTVSCTCTQEKVVYSAYAAIETCFEVPEKYEFYFNKDSIDWTDEEYKLWKETDFDCWVEDAFYENAKIKSVLPEDYALEEVVVE